MSWSWSELRPIDGFLVRMTESFSELDQKTIMLLYQPLIGSLAVNLYLTFFYRLERDAYVCKGGSHRELMITTGEQLPVLLESRKKLEAVGLMRTFVQRQNEDERTFLYELKTPLAAKDFFEDPFLGVFLQNRIGANKFRQVRSRFSVPNLEGEWTEKTVLFNDVYQSVHDSELQIDEQNFDENLLEKDEREGPAVSADRFDLDVLKTCLPSFFHHDALLTKQVLETVTQLAFVYRVDEMNMSRLLVEAMVGDESVDTSLLRSKVKRWYRMSNGQAPPKLGLRSSSLDDSSGGEEQKAVVNEDEKMAMYYNRISPFDLLESLSEGATVSPADLRLAESLISDYKLPAGVANTLIDYVMRTNDKKLDAALVQKIAGHWSRKKIQTVEDAMTLAKQEYRSRKEAKEKSKQPQQPKAPQKKQQRSKSGQAKQDRLPKWLTGEVTEANDDQKRKKADEERQKFETLLQQYRKG